jgi:hypothetical protein
MLDLNNWQDKIAYYKERIRNLFKNRSVYIYEIKGALPKCYIASGVLVPETTESQHFLAEVSRFGPLGRAVVEKNVAIRQLPSLDVGDNAKGLTNVNCRFSNDKYVAQLPDDADGLFILNIPFSPFWSADVDGTSVEAFPVNMVQMAIRIPKHASRIQFKYTRQLFRERMYDQFLASIFNDGTVD